MFLSGDRVVVFGYGDLQFLPAESRLAPVPTSTASRCGSSTSTSAIRRPDGQPHDGAARRLCERPSRQRRGARGRSGVGPGAAVGLRPAHRGRGGGGQPSGHPQLDRRSVAPGLLRARRPGQHRERGRLVDCERVHRPEQFGGLGTVTVATIDMAAGLGDRPVDAVGVLGTGETVYSNPTGLYVATTDWQWQKGPEDDIDLDEVTTQIHRFDISQPTATTYVASGSVPGFVLNQWALDEYQGNLRVATTKAPMWWGSDVESESLLTVLATAGETLVPVGQVGGSASASGSRRCATSSGHRRDVPPDGPALHDRPRRPGPPDGPRRAQDQRLLDLSPPDRRRPAARRRAGRLATKASPPEPRSRCSTWRPRNPVRIGQWSVAGGDSEAQFDSRASCGGRRPTSP